MIHTGYQYFSVCKKICTYETNNLNHIRCIFDFLNNNEGNDTAENNTYYDQNFYDFEGVDESFFETRYPERQRSIYEKILEYEPSYDDEDVYDLLSNDEREEEIYYSDYYSEAYNTEEPDTTDYDDYNEIDCYQSHQSTNKTSDLAILINFTSKANTHVEVARSDIESETFDNIIKNIATSRDIFEIRFSDIHIDNQNSLQPFSNAHNIKTNLVVKVIIYGENACFFFCNQTPILTKFCTTKNTKFIRNLIKSNHNCLYHVNDHYDYLNKISELNEIQNLDGDLF